MGVLLKADLDTNLGSTKEIYIRIENINLNRTFGRVKVAVTYWIDQDHSEVFKHSEDRHPVGQISNTIVLYDEENSLGEEVELPTVFEFDLKKPEKIKIPIYETREVAEEVPYIRFDDLGRKQTAFRTVKHNVKEKIGEKEDITQVLDFDIEKTLIAWCYGQIKAQLGKSVPIELLEDR